MSVSLEQLMTSRQVADVLQVSQRAVELLVKSGELTAVRRTPGAHYRIDPADLRSYIESNKTVPAGRPGQAPDSL